MKFIKRHVTPSIPRLMAKVNLTWFFTLFLALCGSALADEDTKPGEQTPAATLREKWGIEIASLRMSGQGYFVDFRYKVLDPEKARPLADKQYKPHLIDEATGQKLKVPTTPKLGPLRQTAQALAAGKIYFMFFGNSRGIIKRGGKVTVVIGDCRIEHLTVE